jgi:hypothetical protein
VTVRTYRHAVTGREVTVAEGSRMAALVEGDANYSEVKSSDAPKKRAAKKSTAKKSK